MNLNPHLVNFDDEQASNGLLQTGLPPEIARNYIEMGAAVRKGILFEDYAKHVPTHNNTRMEEFATNVFAGAFNA